MNRKSTLIFLLLIDFLFTYNIIMAQPLAGTDNLGRTLIQNNSAGNLKKDKYVAIFYFLTHGDGTAENYWDLSEIVPNRL